MAVAAMRAALPLHLHQLERAHAPGLSAVETQHWADRAREALPADAQRQLWTYAGKCRQWEEHLRAIITNDEADADWDMDSADGVELNPFEVELEARFRDAGLAVDAQVGVSRHGGMRSGGWLGAYWLDLAHRDVPYLLRVDIELDGYHHRWDVHRARDEERNTALRRRGWYILRLDSRAMVSDGPDGAIRQVLAVRSVHRRAIVLARSDSAGDRPNPGEEPVALYRGDKAGTIQLL